MERKRKANQGRRAGTLVRQLREACGLNKYKMAKALGMSWSNYHRFENEGACFTAEMLLCCIALVEDHNIPWNEVRNWLFTESNNQ